jgi:hypothetical protein
MPTWAQQKARSTTEISAGNAGASDLFKSVATEKTETASKFDRNDAACANPYQVVPNRVTDIEHHGCHRGAKPRPLIARKTRHLIGGERPFQISFKRHPGDCLRRQRSDHQQCQDSVEAKSQRSWREARLMQTSPKNNTKKIALCESGSGSSGIVGSRPLIFA